MIYDYQCDDCENKYTKHNSMADMDNSGECPDCGSDDTKKIMSTPKFKTSGGGHGKGWDGKGQMK